MTDQKQNQTDQSRPAWLELVIAYRLFIGAILSLALIGVIGYVWINGVPEISIGTTGKVVLVSLFLAVPTGAILARPVVRWLYHKDSRYLVVLGLHDEAGVWELSPAAWSKLDVVEGELNHWQEARVPLYGATEFDPDTLEARGTWRGSLPDRDLARSLIKVDEIRQVLEDDAKRGFAIETMSFTIVRNATRDAVKSVVKTFERGTLPDEGEAIGDRIDQAIERFDLEKTVENELPDGEFSENIRSQVDLEGVPDDADQEASADD